MFDKIVNFVTFFGCPVILNLKRTKNNQAFLPWFFIDICISRRGYTQIPGQQWPF